MLSRALRGGRDMTSGSARSMPSASAGKQSVKRLIHSKCTGSRIMKPSIVAVKMLSTSLMFEPSRNLIARWMLS